MMTELMQEAGLVGGVCPKVEPGGASSCPPSRAPGP